MYKFYYLCKYLFKLILGSVLLLYVSVLTVPPVPSIPPYKEFKCLVDNIYYEAVGEPFEGKVAVGIVTLNRVNHPKYPKTICEVVYSPYQFSWTVKSKRIKTNTVDWYKCVEAAVYAYNTRGNFTATHFHNNSINPKWKLKKVARIGNHHFYSI